MKRTLTTLLFTCALAAILGLVVAGPAAAKTPCWKALINDWYDGRIDGTYAIPCYQQAINHLPTDVSQYSSAASDIRRAQAAALDQKKTHKSGTVTPPATTDKGDGGGTGGNQPGSGPQSGGDGTSTTPATPTNTTPGRRVSSPISSVINAGSDHADSVPIPLLVLAGIAGLLLAAGSAGFIARRVQARRLPARRSQ